MANLFKQITGLARGTHKAVPVVQSLTGPISDTFYTISGNAIYKFGNERNWIAAYAQCAPLATIIGRKADAFTNGDTMIVDRNTKEPLPGYDKILNQIANPNPFQTQTMFENMIYKYLQVEGWAITMKEKPYGFESRAEVTAKEWILPSQNLEVKWNESPFYAVKRNNLIKSIGYKVNGKVYPIDPRKCTVYTNHKATFEDNLARPNSPLCGLEYPIDNIIKIYEASGSLLESNGAMGILSNRATDSSVGSITTMNEGAKNQLESDYVRKYGIGKDKKKLIITSLHLEYQQMALPIKDLELLPQMEAYTKEISARLGYPYFLLGMGSNRTYDNAPQDGKDLYNNTIIPEAKHFYEQRTQDLLAGDEKAMIVADFSKVAALQEDEGKKAKAAKDWAGAYKIYWESDLMTRNQILEKQEIEPVKDGDLYKSQWDKKNETN